MLKHALRSLSRMRTYTVINLVGLVVSLTGAIIIARYVHQELTVNHYVPELDRTFLLVNHGGYTNDFGYHHTEAINGNHIDNWQDPFADPDVECFSRFICEYGGLDMVVDNVHYQIETTRADSMFLRILPRKVVEGTLERKSDTDVIITRNLAEKIWHGESAVGKTLCFEQNTLTVVGVVEQPETKYSFAYELLLPLNKNNESNYIGWSIVRLREGADYKAYNKRQKAFDEVFGNGETYTRHFQLFPLGNLYFDSPVYDLNTGATKFFEKGNKQNVIFLVGGALLLLLVGLFNYVNIFSILIKHRRKGIAVRMIFGAKTTDVFWMVFVENLLLTGVAVGIAWLLVSLASSFLMEYYNLTLIPSPVFDIGISLAIVFLLPLAVAIPVAISHRHSGKMDNMKTSNNGTLRHGVQSASLWLQYSFTFFLIVVSTYSICQLYYMLNSDLGYKTENVISFDLFPEIRNNYESEGWQEREALAKEKAEDFMNRIKASPLFIHSCYGNRNAALTSEKTTIDKISIWSLKTDLPNSEFQKMGRVIISADEIELYGLKLLEGSKPDFERDNYQTYRMYLSRSAKEKLGICDISKTKIQCEERLWWSWVDGEFTNDNPPFTIAGVYDDFCMTHLSMEGIPFFILIRPSVFHSNGFFLASYQPDKREEVVAFLQKLYEEANGKGGVMPHTFIEDEIADIYAEDSRVARIFTTFALLSILLSCLGLFGISLYDVRSRRREIALRKVHGAKFKDIFRLIVRRYLIALGVAILLGTPLATYALHFYIQDYVHHVPLTPWYFFGAAIIMFLLSLATIYWQTSKAARENPADVMKSE